MTLIYVLRVKKTVDTRGKIWYNTNRRIKPDNRALPSKSAQRPGPAELCAFLSAECELRKCEAPGRFSPHRPRHLERRKRHKLTFSESKPDLREGKPLAVWISDGRNSLLRRRKSNLLKYGVRGRRTTEYEIH